MLFLDLPTAKLPRPYSISIGETEHADGPVWVSVLFLSTTGVAAWARRFGARAAWSDPFPLSEGPATLVRDFVAVHRVDGFELKIWFRELVVASEDAGGAR